MCTRVHSLLVCFASTLCALFPSVCPILPYLSVCLSVCLSVYSNQLSQHDEKERLMEADSANSDLHICVVCMKSLMNTTVSEDHCTRQPSYIDADLGLVNILLPSENTYTPPEHCVYMFIS